MPPCSMDPYGPVQEALAESQFAPAMPPAVLGGRVVKTSKVTSTRTCPNDFVKRPHWLELLGKYNHEIKYYYLHLRYPRMQVYEIMEIIFKIGATPKDYQYFLNQPEFQKNLTDTEWHLLAPYYFACAALNIRIAVKLNDAYIIESDTVRKEIGRHVLPSRSAEMTKDIARVDPSRPYKFGRITAFNPAEFGTHQSIPGSIISRLPCGRLMQYLLRACQKIAQETGQIFDDLVESNLFRYTRRLIYLVSNNILSWAELDGILDELYLAPEPPRLQDQNATSQVNQFSSSSEGKIPSVRQFLKALLEMTTILVKFFAESLMPLLIIRRDEDLIKHIFQTYGAESIAVKWYIGLFEIDSKQNMGYFFTRKSDPMRFYQKYSLHPCGFDYYKHVRAFLIEGVRLYQPVALTKQEAVALVACAIQGGVVTLNSMSRMLPPKVSLAKIEERYERVYGISVLESKSLFNIQQLLDFGFRRNIHILAIEAVLKNNFEDAVLLLPRTKLNLSAEKMELLELGRLSSSYGNIWDILGGDSFSELVRQVKEESADLACKRSLFHIQDLIPISFYLKNKELRDFILGFLGAHSDPNGHCAGSLLWSSVFVYLFKDPSEFCIRLFKKSERIIDQTNDEEMANWACNILESITQLTGWKYDDYQTFRGKSLQSWLDSSIRAANRRKIRFLVQFGADVNGLNDLGEAPIITALLKKKDTGLERTADEMGDEIDVFLQLLAAGANIKCLDKFQTSTEGVSNQLDPDFLEAVQKKDTSRIGNLWDNRFHCESEVGDTKPQMSVPMGSVVDQSFPRSENPPYEPLQILTLTLACTSSCLTKQQGASLRIKGAQYLSDLKDHVFDLLRSSFLRDQTDYERQRCVEHILMFLKESRRWEEAQIKPVIPNVWENTPITILQYLADFGDPHLLDAFFKYWPKEAKAQISQTYSSPSPLQLAAANNRFECVIFLVNKGASPQEPVSYSFWTTEDDNSRVVDLLGGGRTALYYAVVHGNFEMGQYLVERSRFADIHARIYEPSHSGIMSRKMRWFVQYKGQDGSSILERAVMLGRIDFVGLFLNFDINARSHALEAATKYRQRQVAGWIHSFWGGVPPAPTMESDKSDSRTGSKNLKRVNSVVGLPPMKAILPKIQISAGQMYSLAY